MVSDCFRKYCNGVFYLLGNSRNFNLETDLMEEMIYEVVTIDGDYANLRNVSNEDGDLKLVARALLPAEISEGCKLSYYAFEYTMLE